MFGRHERQTAKATIVAADLGTLHTSDMAAWDFVVDVQPTDGALFRAVTSSSFATSGKVPRAGDVVNVSFISKALDDVRLEL